MEWPGHVPVKPWLAQTSVFVLPSYREGLSPARPREAMAMARPDPHDRRARCRETVIEGLNGCSCRRAMPARSRKRWSGSSPGPN